MAKRGITEPEQAKLFLVADAIKARRKELGVSQETASLSANVHVNHWTRIEQARVNPSLTTMMRIADALDTTVTALLGGL